MPHEFRPDEELTSEELRAVLERLDQEGDGLFRPVTDHVTIEAVHEATGYSREQIAEALAELRRGDEASRLAEALRRLEEPTYRVERPGHSYPDPAVTGIRKREELFGKVLDDLPNAESPKTKAKYKPSKAATNDGVHHTAAKWILIAVVATFVFLLAIGLLRSFF